MAAIRLQKRRKQKGSALITSFGVLSLLSVAAASYVNSATHIVRVSKRQTEEVQATHVCEAGVQAVLRSLWRPFKVDQNFTDMDAACDSATPSAPKATLTGTIPGVGKYSAGIIRYVTPNDDSYVRIATVRAVAWFDRNNNNALDNDEPCKTVDVAARFELARSQVFDYTYFVNNYGWMDGFGVNDLIVNGDMRANGNFDFLNGSPTINGSVYAASNDKLTPAAAGLINQAPVKWSNATYTANYNNVATVARDRWRQPYDPAKHGAKGTAEYEKWRDFVFDSDASIQNNRVAGAGLFDATGSKAWQRTSVAASPAVTTLDTAPTQEVIMPDLSDLSYYTNLSNTYVDTKTNYGDGTANPNAGEGAWIDVWDQTLNGGLGAYKRLTVNGVVNGSAIMVGTAAKPIKIHGPVTFTQDAVIKGYVEGQGTIYTGRNVHVVGSLIYKNPPNFLGSDMQAIDNANEKKDMLALAARASIMMGNPKTFSNPYPLAYMTPPFTKGRYDEDGNWIPPFDANQIDSYGVKKYRSVLGDDALNAVSSGVNQIDAVLYTNFVGGGNIGVGGGGVQFNGTIISKDESLVCWSLPIRMNYDNRIRERTITKQPLIDLKLPRSPIMLRSTWQDRGFSNSR